MPHQCTSCGRTFPDGSKEMLSGCPDCGGNKFQFKPAGAADDGGADPAGGEAAPSDPTPTPDEGPAPDEGPTPTPDEDAAGQSPSEPPNRRPSESADATAADAAGVDSPTASDGTEQIADRSDEDTAQATARSEVVSPDELDRASRDVEPAETPPADEAAQPGIDALRDELNDQFESIRIVSPGQYELNLMELYDRQEYIISLQEDGRYVIEMPDAWGIGDE